MTTDTDTKAGKTDHLADYRDDLTYYDEPRRLAIDLPDEAILQYLVEELGEKRPRELSALHSMQQIRYVMGELLDRYGHGFQVRGDIRQPAGYLRWVLAAQPELPTMTAHGVFTRRALERERRENQRADERGGLF